MIFMIRTSIVQGHYPSPSQATPRYKTSGRKGMLGPYASCFHLFPMKAGMPIAGSGSQVPASL